MNVMTPEPKPFAWSFSRLKNFNTCPLKYQTVDVLKTVKEAENDNLKYGNAAHKAFANRLGKGLPLPAGFEKFEPAMLRILAAPGKLFVEQQYAITESYGPCEWFSKETWFRAIADALVVAPPVALGVDYKFGKVLDDSQQLALLAACIMAHFPDVHAVRTEFWWMASDDVTRVDIKRQHLPQIWAAILPRVAELRQAHETGVFPPKQSGLCRRHCPVTGCRYHGG